MAVASAAAAAASASDVQGRFDETGHRRPPEIDDVGGESLAGCRRIDQAPPPHALRLGEPIEGQVEVTSLGSEQSLEAGKTGHEGVGEVAGTNRLEGDGIELGLGATRVATHQTRLGEEQPGQRAREEAGIRPVQRGGEPLDRPVDVAGGQGDGSEVVVRHRLVLAAARSGGEVGLDLGGGKGFAVAAEP